MTEIAVIKNSSLHQERTRVAVVTEKCICDTDTWSGLADRQVGWEIYVDMSGNLESKTY